MVDRLAKALRKLDAKEQSVFRALLLQIQEGDVSGLDVQKLKGQKDIYRVRRGSMRILFRKTGESVWILAVERRSDTTYHL